MAFAFDSGVKGLIVLAAGGTGGHLFPAQALAEELVRRGYAIHLVTDDRVGEYGRRFPAAQVHIVESDTLTTSKPLRVPGQLYKLFAGFVEARALFKTLEPLAVVGFGGYPSVPPLVAALSQGYPTFIHEQNAVMGRANRFLAARATAIASSFPKIANLSARAAPKVRYVGNPVRDSVLAASFRKYVAPEADRMFRLLVFGGSQGAQIFSEVIPAALTSLPQTVRKLLSVTQQVRQEDMGRVQEAYVNSGIDVDLAPFFYDMPERISNAHLVIGRSGASTVAELSVIGRPAILVPLPHSLDNDQLMNARAFTQNGAGWLLEQDDFTPDRLSSLIVKLRYSERDLEAAADFAKMLGKADAAKNLAELITRLALDTALKDAGLSAASGEDSEQ
ncbi:MAG: undecaprenyldiphospho-muramoylpentapeptide beta-N-acetylglucosaminyltransferase [Pseudomonadota bacterium]